MVVNRVVLEAADGVFMANRCLRETSYLAEIDTTFSNVPRQRLALRDGDVMAIEALLALASELA
ncbi:MAG: hypothetical protein AAFX81_12120 [Pseudomonadota bacterium]